MPTRRRNRRERRLVIPQQQATFTVPFGVNSLTQSADGDNRIVFINFGIPDVTSASEVMLSGVKFNCEDGSVVTAFLDTLAPQQVNLSANTVGQDVVSMQGWICVAFNDALAPPVILDLNGLGVDPPT